MITLTNEQYNQLEDILYGYTNELDELDPSSDEYSNLKYELDCKFCGFGLWQEKQMLHAELVLGNVMIENNVLTCIYNNKLHKFNMAKRKAKNGEYAYITNSSDTLPFNNKYIGRCFKVHAQPTKEELEWVKDFVGVNIEGLDTGWCLYDDQYVVLEEIN